MSQNRPNRLRPETLLLLLLGLATALKVAWALNSVGSCDAMLFFIFAKSMQLHGMVSLYTGSTVFNHTPLTGGLIHWLFNATHFEYSPFAAVLRIACSVADIALVMGLLHVRKLTGQPPWWALWLFAISPVSIMVSGFHGNIDPIMIMFLFFAAVAVLKDQPLLSGVMFAAACNVKIVPILVAPVFIFYWIGRGRQAAIRFMGASGGLMLAGAAWGLIYCPAAFIRNVFGYGSYWGTWGVTYWLRMTGNRAFALMSFVGLSDAQNRVIFALKILTLAGVLTLAWRRRKLGGLEFFTTLGAAFTWIFIFMPGAGTQYMVWYAPFILLVSPRWWLALTAGSVVYMFRFYHSTSGYHFPWNMALPHGPEESYWSFWTNLVWFPFILLLIFRASSWLRIKSLVAPAPAPAIPASAGAA